MLTATALILWRRRFWTTLALIVSLVAAAGAYSALKPTQDANATVLLLPSAAQPGVVGLSNPFNSLGDTTLVMTSVVQVLVSDDKTANRLRSQGLTATYTVNPNTAQNSGPSLVVKVSDKSAVLAERTLQGLLSEISQQLAAVQQSQHVPSQYLITSLVVTYSTHTTPSHKLQVQAAVIAFVVILLLLVLLLLYFDRRRTRKASIKAAQAANPDSALDLSAVEPASVVEPASDVVPFDDPVPESNGAVPPNADLIDDTAVGDDHWRPRPEIVWPATTRKTMDPPATGTTNPSPPKPTPKPTTKPTTDPTTSQSTTQSTDPTTDPTTDQSTTTSRPVPAGQ
jgi:hypothetical protein